MTEADALINLCKMKTHALERITGGVKNLYGCVSGLNKAKGHTKYSNADSFARMLVDLNRMVQPRLCVMDGIMAMEGNGPTSGDPIPMNLLLMSADPVALDTVFARLVHLDPRLVPTIVHGDAMGLGCGREEEIRLLGEEGWLTMDEVVRRWGNPDFQVDRSRRRSNMWSRVNSLPEMLSEEAVHCGKRLQKVRRLCQQLPGGGKSPPVSGWEGASAGVRLPEMYPLFLLSGDVSLRGYPGKIGDLRRRKREKTPEKRRSREEQRRFLAGMRIRCYNSPMASAGRRCRNMLDNLKKRRSGRAVRPAAVNRRTEKGRAR